VKLEGVTKICKKLQIGAKPLGCNSLSDKDLAKICKIWQGLN
jgi:hypothetical protein